MLSVNYSLSCTTFDPKGKILQVRLLYFVFDLILYRLNMQKKQSNKDQPL